MLDHIERYAFRVNAKTAFDRWSEDPNNRLRLDMPDEASKLLVPVQLLEINGARTRITVVTKNKEKSSLSFYITDRRRDFVTDPEDMRKYLEPLRQMGNNRDGEYSKLVEEMDYFHRNFFENNDGLSLKDYVLLMIGLDALPGEELSVSYYEDRTDLHNRGVATGFYRNLRYMARKLGFKYIAGQNSGDNVGFYLEKLKRSRLSDLSDEVREVIEKNHRGGDLTDPDLFTVDLLEKREQGLVLRLKGLLRMTKD